MADKTINLRPYHCEIKPNNHGFTLEWWCGTEGGKRVKVVLKCEFWWISYLARDLWKAIAYRQNEVNAAKKSMESHEPA